MKYLQIPVFVFKSALRMVLLVLYLFADDYLAHIRILLWLATLYLKMCWFLVRLPIIVPRAIVRAARGNETKRTAALDARRLAARRA